MGVIAKPGAHFQHHSRAQPQRSVLISEARSPNITGLEKPNSIAEVLLSQIRITDIWCTNCNVDCVGQQHNPFLQSQDLTKSPTQGWKSIPPIISGYSLGFSSSQPGVLGSKRRGHDAADNSEDSMTPPSTKVNMVSQSASERDLS